MNGFDFAGTLNGEQLDAVTTIDGPVLVVAGAGSGKTRVIEYRVLNLILNGVSPSSILLLTFTRKSAREMLERSSKHDVRCAYVEGGTFHSFAYKILKKYYNHLGFSSDMSFIDETDAADILHLIAKNKGYLEVKERFPTKGTLQTIISMSINKDLSLEDVLISDYSHFMHSIAKIEVLKTEYRKYKMEKGFLDYDDMLIYLKELLENETIRKEISEKYKFIMVDEFQDTNKIQANIIYLLGKNHRNVMAVGDDTQSIYSFRGAYYKNMFDFPTNFPGTKIIKLQTNYRSTQSILDVSNAVMQTAEKKYTKILYSVNGVGEKPQLVCFKDKDAELNWIVKKIKTLNCEGIEMNKIAVLYRSNYMSTPLQFALMKSDVPFVTYGGIKFIETSHVKDVVAHLRVVLNYKDEVSWLRVFKLLDKVGGKTAEKIYLEIFKNNGWAVGLESFTKGKYSYSEKISKLLALLEKVNSEKLDLTKKIECIIDYYFPFMEKMYDNYPERQDDLKELIEISRKYDSVEEFIADFIVLDPPQKKITENRGLFGRDTVVLSTIHSAKGLEWDVVFVMSLIDGCIPVSYSMDDEDSIEEEKRLLYVALTRAKKNLFLTWHFEGNNIHQQNTYNKLSRFVVEEQVINKLAIFAGLRQLNFTADQSRYFSYND